jgi:tetratricopeptide (TPR) repeat protein
MDYFLYAADAAREAGRAMLARDDAIDPEGLERMAAAIEKRRQLGENWYNMLLVAHLADAHRRRGNLEQARALIEGAFADAEPVYLPEIWRVKGEIEAASARGGSAASRKKRIEAAAECFRSALAISREQGTRIFELRAATALARVLEGTDGSGADLADLRLALPQMADGADARAAADVLGQVGPPA